MEIGRVGKKVIQHRQAVAQARAKIVEPTQPS
jgi:hypothetical protein